MPHLTDDARARTARREREFDDQVAGLRAELARRDEARALAAQRERELEAQLEALRDELAELGDSRAQALRRERDLEEQAARSRAKLGAERAQNALTPVPHYPVATNLMREVDGVTAEDATALREYGVNLTDELLYANIPRLADATGIARDRLQRWRVICELMAVKGIGPAWGPRLADAGIGGIRELARVTPHDLTRTLISTYANEDVSPEAQLLMERTLPARASHLVKLAKQADKAL